MLFNTPASTVLSLLSRRIKTKFSASLKSISCWGINYISRPFDSEAGEFRSNFPRPRLRFKLNPPASSPRQKEGI